MRVPAGCWRSALEAEVEDYVTGLDGEVDEHGHRQPITGSEAECGRRRGNNHLGCSAVWTVAYALLPGCLPGGSRLAAPSVTDRWPRKTFPPNVLLAGKQVGVAKLRDRLFGNADHVEVDDRPTADRR